MRPVFLIGFMGTGKSTLGRALAARRRHLRFVDLDEAAEAILGRTAREAFAAGDAESFRKAESEALAQVAGSPDVVVACGGGTPCFGRNMDMMLEAGTVVRLTANPERLLRRLAEAPAGQRPLLAGLRGEELRRRVDELQRQREAFYSRAHATFDASALETPEEVDRTCCKFTELFLKN